MEQINDAFVLMDNLENDTSISHHVLSNLESFLATPLTPLARSWDNFAGDYISNAMGNGMFYAILAWTGLHSVYTKIMSIAMRRSPWSNNRTFEITEALWYITVHSLLLLVSLWMVDPGYVLDILHMDISSFSLRIIWHSVRVVPRNVMLIFVACSTLQIYSALQEILHDKNRSAFNKALTAGAFITMYCFKKIELLLMTNASFCIYRAVSEILRVYRLMTVPPTIRQKVTRSPTKNSQMSDNRQQLQTLYNTVKGALILKRSLRRHQEKLKEEKSSVSENSTVEINEFSDKLLPQITETTPLIQSPDPSTEVIDSSPTEI